METHQLRAFLAVAEELHFGRAALRLHLAQPPLSRTIKHLERELGASLFERSTRSVRLTAVGRALVEPARAALRAVDHAEQTARAAARGEVGMVRIAFAGLSSYQLVAAWARLARQRHPGIRLELDSQNFARPAMEKLLRNGTDLALGRWDEIPAGVSCRVAAHDALIVALPDTHPLAGRERLAFRELSDDAFVSLRPYEGSVLSDRLRRLAHGAGFEANLVQVAPDTQSALALVGAEVGCHLTLASVADEAKPDGIAFVPVSDATPDVHLRLAWQAGNDDPSVAAVLAVGAELLPPVGQDGTGNKCFGH